MDRQTDRQTDHISALDRKETQFYNLRMALQAAFPLSQLELSFAVWEPAVCYAAELPLIVAIRSLRPLINTLKLVGHAGKEGYYFFFFFFFYPPADGEK